MRGGAVPIHVNRELFSPSLHCTRPRVGPTHGTHCPGGLLEPPFAAPNTGPHGHARLRLQPASSVLGRLPPPPTDTRESVPDSRHPVETPGALNPTPTFTPQTRVGGPRNPLPTPLEPQAEAQNTGTGSPEPDHHVTHSRYPEPPPPPAPTCAPPAPAPTGLNPAEGSLPAQRGAAARAGPPPEAAAPRPPRVSLRRPPPPFPPLPPPPPNSAGAAPPGPNSATAPGGAGRGGPNRDVGTSFPLEMAAPGTTSRPAPGAR